VTKRTGAAAPEPRWAPAARGGLPRRPARLFSLV